VQDGSYHVFVKGGREDTGLDAIAWAREVESRGAGEILLTSMDTDGVKNGFDIEITQNLSKILNIPVIASGGAGNMEHFKEAFDCGASAALAASIFHFKEVDIMDLKRYLQKNGVNVRI
jgi:cyclase